MAKRRETKSDYEIGYGKPPAEHRFKPGRSGNPKGRPRGAKDFATILDEALNEKLTVTENGKQTRRSKKEVMTKVLVNKALKGDLRAWTELVKLSREAGLDQAAPQAEAKPLPPSHTAIIARALAARRAAEERAEDEGGDEGQEAA